MSWFQTLGRGASLGVWEWALPRAPGGSPRVWAAPARRAQPRWTAPSFLQAGALELVGPMGAAPASASLTRTVSQTINAKTRGWGVYEFVLTASLACSEQPHRCACLTVRPAHRCSVSDRACAGCVIPKTCGCYSAVNEVVHFIKVNKVQFSKLPGAVVSCTPDCTTKLSVQHLILACWPPLARPEVCAQ